MRDAPSDARLAYPGEPGEGDAGQLAGTGRGQPLPAAHRPRQDVVNRGADRLVDGSAGTGPRPEVHGCQVTVVDVARDDGDRSGCLAVSSGGEPGQQPLEIREGPAERRPVLQVHGAAQPLAAARESPPPHPVADGLVPCLQGVDAARKHQRQGRREHHVVPVAGNRLGDPFPLRLVDHQPLGVVRHHPAAARVDHHDPHAAEITADAPPDACGPAIRAMSEITEHGRRVVDLPHLTPHLVGVQFGGRKVAKVLIEPVAHERADDPGAPPRLRLVVAAPGR